MARPSKLSPAQWREVERRSAEGEGARALAKEFGVDEAAIRRRVNPQTPQVRKVAAKLAEVQTELAALPLAQQYNAISLADKLRNISVSLAAGAELQAANFHRLSSLAQTELAKVDDADPMASADKLKSSMVLTTAANDAAKSPIALIAANKETVTKINNDQPADALPPERPKIARNEWLTLHGLS